MARGFGGVPPGVDFVFAGARGERDIGYKVGFKSSKEEDDEEVSWWRVYIFYEEWVERCFLSILRGLLLLNLKN